ncbi:DUF2490 domain-containing protein [Flavobacterium sp.]|uniref:DUF2490 domain-containing protein n=1 Tax=Flavobacterium sp. TaxID=239 RepID=UPI00286BB942|nr:DUF2490 domain-containing protein [Flavobacterium sp.]
MNNTYNCLLLFLFTTVLFSQENLGSWNILNVNLKINSKWNAFTEAQLRSLSFYDEFHYYEIKAGATYKFSKDFTATSGFGSYNTYSEGGSFKNPIQNKEIRTWLQINLKNPLRFFTLEHRYRAEQRFTSNGYRNRFRYRLGATIPVNKKIIEPKTFYFSVWNELFFTNGEPFFERNRLFLGCGYEVNKNVAIQTGYIYQFDYKINDETGRNFLNIALLYNFDLSKQEEKEFIPTTSD